MILLSIFALRNTNHTDRWCNGSTADFGSACLGSNPGWTTEGNLLRLSIRFFYSVGLRAFDE